MREIKFRAWDGKEMSHSFGLGHDLAGDFHNDAHKMLQFTGLKDKNGEEIYEGDIVRVVYDGTLEYAGGDDEIREVTYGASEDEYYPAFDLKGHDMETNALSVAKNNGDIEIIGNIYETPKLLKGYKGVKGEENV